MISLMVAKKISLLFTRISDFFCLFRTAMTNAEKGGSHSTEEDSPYRIEMNIENGDPSLEQRSKLKSESQQSTEITKTIHNKESQETS